MKEIKLTKNELYHLLMHHSSCLRNTVDTLDNMRNTIDTLVNKCKDLEKMDEEDLFVVYNAFCEYLHVENLRVRKMTEFNSLNFYDNIEQKKLTEYVDLDDTYFIMDLYFAGGCIRGFRSFSDLKSNLEYRIPFSLQQIKKMLEFTFEDDEEGEEDEK